MRQFIIYIFFLFPLFGEILEEAAIQERLEKASAVEGNPEFAEAVEVWEGALEAIKASEVSIARERELQAEITRLDSLKPLQFPEAPEGDPTLIGNEAFLQKIEVTLQNSRDRLKVIEIEDQNAIERKTKLTESGVKVRAELNAFSIPSLGTGELKAAQYQKAVQEKRRLEVRLAEIEAEQNLQRKESALYTERVIRRKSHIRKLEAMALDLEEVIEQQKEKKARENKRKVDELEEELSGAPKLSAILDEIKGFRQRKEDLEGRLQEARIYVDSIKEVRKKIDEQFRSAKGRIKLLEDAGLDIDDETGVLLRRQRALLPSVDEISTRLRDKLESAAQVELSMMSLSDKISRLSTLNEDEISEIRIKNPRISRERIDQLLAQRTSVRRELDGSLRQLKDELTKGTEVAKLTIAEIKDYSEFIDERLLWIKSTKTVHWMEPVDEWGRVIRLFQGGSLGAALNSIQENLFEEIALVIFVVLVSLVIVLKRRHLRAILEESSLKAKRRNCTSLLPTLRFICAAVLLSIWVPLVLWCAAELISAPISWKVALFRLAWFLFCCLLFLKFTRPDGLFVSHFKMEPALAAILYRHLKWLVGVASPFVFLVPALTLSEENTESGRFTFILGMVALAAFLHNLFNPKRSNPEEEGESGGFAKLIYFLVMLVPFVFIVGSSLGYFASVLTLRDQVAATVGLLILAFIVIRFLTRWTLVSRRGLAISQALKRREAVIAQREREAEGQGKHDEIRSLEEVEAEAVNVVEVEEQTTQLLKFATYFAVCLGLWAIWSSILPALKVLDDVRLWGDGAAIVEASPATPSVTESDTEPEKNEKTSAGDKVRQIVLLDDGRVTLQDLLLSAIFFGLTFVAARNIPSLLSLTLFNRINLGPGGNFALTTTVRYLIVLIGVVVALAQIGVTWGKVQWLAAAVSLGIGFGLQEIFANFVAGIILLFERPIRLGDVVTVGEISGKVTQIKIRATTIQQFNNRELLVPNKEFITSQLVNWTLKDSVLRFEIPVGIAYGSDTDKASRVLREIVEEHPKVLKDPEPIVLFTSFGNSTLDFQMRGFVATVEDLIKVQSELHYRVDDAFRKAGIEIAFPQQDVHLRSLPEGMEVVKKS